MANADIQLLFGVLGDGSLSGESGSLIQEQLTQIVSALNKNPLKVKVALDTEAGGQKSWSSQMQTKLNTLSANGKFSVQISRLGIGAGAISDFKKQLNAVINSLNLDKGTSITLSAEGIGEVKRAVGDAGAVIDNAAQKVAAFNVRLRELGSQGTTIKNALSTLNTAVSTESEQAQLSVLSERYKQLAIDIEAVHVSKTKDTDALVRIESEAAAIQREIDAIKQKKQAEKEAAEATRKAAEESARAHEESNRQAQREAQNNEKIRGTLTERNALYKQISDAIARIEKAQRDWSAAATGSSKSEYQSLDGYVSRLQSLQKEFDGLNKVEIKERFSAINKEFSNSSRVIKEAGENTKTLTDRIGGLASKFASWLTVSQVVMQAYRAIKQMVTAVVEVDTAMTELKKVTDETEATYSRFLENAVVRSKGLGATVSDVVSASADFARLGYSLAEASDLADAALVYKNVGDGIQDVGEASESVISTMKAFGIEAANAMSIVDRFNEVGNNYAISSKGVGDALMRSAAALAAAGNTLNESIALVTAANNVVQNPEKVGTTLKTVSMFLRAAKTEAEEAGESTDGMANSVSELRAELLALTGGKLDIQIDEDTFKSTYQILKELSEVWGELTDISQANILEMVGGKRNSNVVAALLTNFETAEKVMKTVTESAGSALAENEKYLNSIKGTIAEFKAAFQELSITLIDSEFVKDIVELGTGLLGVLNSVAEIIDAIGGLNTVLYVTAGTIAIIKADSIVATLAKLGTKIKGFGDTIRIALMYFSDGFSAARKAGLSFTKSVSAGFQTMAGAASTAQIAVAALVAVISAVILLKNALEDADRKLIETQEQIIENNAAQRESNKAFEDAYITYMRYADKVEITASEESALNDAIKTITDTIGKKSDALDGLTGKTEEYTKALKEQTKTELEDAHAIAIENRYAIQKKLMTETYSSWSGSTITIDLSGRTGIEEFVAARNTLNELMGDYFDQGRYGDELEPINWDTLQNTPDGVSAVVDYYYDLLEVEKELALQGNINNDIYNRAKEITNSLAGSVAQYVQLKYEEIAAEYKFQHGIPDTIEEFKKYREYLHSELGSMFSFDDGGDTLTNTIDEFLSSSDAYSEFMKQMNAETSDATETVQAYTASLEGLSETISKLKSAYDVLSAAEKEMAASGGLSAETIASLASVEEDYIDYLYEENGLIKLNTEAWQANANAKMLSEMSEIEAEIYSLSEQNRLLAEKNDALRESIGYYEEQRAIASDGGIWNQLISDATDSVEDNNDAIAENSDLIRENQGLLAVYGSLYGDITGDLSAYNAALNNFANVATTIDSVATSFASLANLQDTVANGFTLSLDKALEYARVYPEILNSAKATANGELALNEAVVNSFIAGKQAELITQIDGEIAKLEADKAVLEAKKANATAQLELAKAVVDGESTLTREEAIYKLNTGNALAEALVAMEVDKVTAYKLATAAMSENEQEFTRIAMECFQNMDEGSAQMAYNMAHAIYVNAKNSSMSIADIAKQAHQTALAIRGMANGVVDGASTSVFSGGSGVYVGTYDYAAQDGNFVGADYQYQSKQISLDEYISDLELDISDYENAISQIEGQIATLEALKSTPFESFKNLVQNASDIVGSTDTPGSSSGGSSGGSSGSDPKDEVKDAEKIVEEYIAAIDEYYEALKRLEAIQERRKSLEKKLEHTSDLSEKIFLSSGLINIYQEESQAEQDLMAAKKATIAANVGALRMLGFQVEYNNSTNELYIRNLEHLNQLTASSTGKYDTLQEATNALRKETEELIDVTEKLNEDNIDAAGNIEDLSYAALEAKNNIIDYIEEIYEKQSESYQKIINLRKELIQSAKDEYDYESDIADKVKEIAELQSRIDQLSLDSSRSAQAERNTLIQELQQMQKELADTQSDHSMDAQTDALDKMAEDFETNKQNEIELLRGTVDASKELWNAFYQTILGQNVSVGSSIDTEVAGAWIRAAQAVNEYSAAVSGVMGVGTIVSTIPRYHDGGIVSEKNLGKDEALAILQTGEAVLNDRKQQSLYRIIDFQSELSKRLGVAIGEIQPPAPSINMRDSLGAIAQNLINNSQSMVFEPRIEVVIHHNGEMSDASARSYGNQIADITIDKLYGAFERRGINSTRGSRLKP